MVEAGWYADPAGRYPHRYWDGTRWSPHVAGPRGQAIDPLPPLSPDAASGQAAAAGGQAPAVSGRAPAAGGQVPAVAGQAPTAAHSDLSQDRHPEQRNQPPAQPSHGRQPFHGDPAELQSVMAELGIRPMPAGDGTPFGEPMLILAHSAERPDSLEWWTPAGLLVAVALIIEKQQPGSLNAASTDQQSGAMVGSHLVVTSADGTPIASTVRTLKPTKPPTYLDDPNGQRLASIAQEKIISKVPSMALTAASGAPIGRYVGSDMRGRAMTLSDSAGTQLATVVKHGKWDGANVALEFSRNRPFQTPTDWLANRAVAALWPIRRERICSVLIRDRPPADAMQALLGFMSPLLLEHTLSLL